MAQKEIPIGFCLMKLGKALALTAVSGILAALTGCGGNVAEAKDPSTNAAPPAAKDCCKGKNECKNKSGCKTEANACAGQNECKHKGTSCPHGS